jgi:hypothetical protein
MGKGDMRISEKDLRAQFDRMVDVGDWIREAEVHLDLPPYMLFALGSRETNLKNLISPNGHGWGYWQRDDRSWIIPKDYLDTPDVQATDAAALLMSHMRFFRTAYPYIAPWLPAICAYNAGRGGVRRKLDAGGQANSATTNGDYGSDVLERWTYFIRWGWGKL